MAHVFCTDCMKAILRGLDKDALTLLAELTMERLMQTELMEKTGLSIYRLRAALNCLRGARLITLDLDKQYMLSENGEKLLELAQVGTEKM